MRLDLTTRFLLLVMALSSAQMSLGQAPPELRADDPKSATINPVIDGKRISYSRSIIKEDIVTLVNRTGQNWDLISFFDCTFENTIALEHDFGRHFRFTECVFKRGLTGMSSAVSAEYEFVECTFSSKVSISKMAFKGTISFAESTFQDAFEMKESKFGTNTTQRSLILRQCHFLNRVMVMSCAFQGVAISETRFDAVTFFVNCTFLPRPGMDGSSDEIRFLFCQFRGATHFTKSMFLCKSAFVSSTFSSPTYFLNTSFAFQTAFPGGTTFESDAVFERASFPECYDNKISKAKIAYFGGVRFQGNVDFTATSGDAIVFPESEQFSASNVGVDEAF